MKNIVPNLWFDNNAVEAVQFYTSTFKNSKINKIHRYGKASAEASGQPEGSVMTIAFELDGEPFVAINGGPVFSFTPAISLMVNCDSQEELDVIWDRLTDGGESIQCGWLKDKFGVSWQIVPTEIEEMLQHADAEAMERVMKAMLQMKKLDIAELKKAFDQK